MGPADQVVLALHGDLATLADTYLLRMCHYVCLGCFLSVCTVDKVQRDVTERFQTETENASFPTTTNTIRCRCSISVILAPWCMCRDLHLLTYLSRKLNCRNSSNVKSARSAWALCRCQAEVRTWCTTNWVVGFILYHCSALFLTKSFMHLFFTH